MNLSRQRISKLVSSSELAIVVWMGGQVVVVLGKEVCE